MPDNAKDRILQKIKQALTSSVPVPFPEHTQLSAEAVLPPQADADLAILFAEQFTQIQGQFAYCINLPEAVQQLQELGDKKGISKWYCNDVALRTLLENAGWKAGWYATLPDCHASITAAEALVARTGSLLLSSTASSGRTTSVYAPIHICLAAEQQLVYDIADAMQLLQQKYGQHLPSCITLASGPSRTADIEKTLVTGVHGPKEVFCFLTESLW
ncbi:LutC/YkgG family protein [Phnomibacter sp. MR]|uniref:LutC/YkgG family protein n=1 Tax=Phnomibacter sp. MR TaxID=3042318 RepID=UPI003A7F9F7D